MIPLASCVNPHARPICRACGQPIVSLLTRQFHRECRAKRVIAKQCEQRKEARVARAFDQHKTEILRRRRQEQDRWLRRQAG